MVMVKGNLCYQVKNYTIKNYGKEAFDELTSDIPDFKGVIVSNKVYQLESYQKLLYEFRNKFGDDAYEGLCSFMAEKQLSGIFGFFTKFLSVDKLVSKSQFMLSTIFTGGKVTILEKDEKHICLRLGNFPISDTHLYGFEVYIRKILEIASKQTVKSSSIKIDNTTSEFTLNLLP